MAGNRVSATVLPSCSSCTRPIPKRNLLYKKDALISCDIETYTARKVLSTKVQPRFTDTRLIRTARDYGHCSLSIGKVHTFSINSTRLIWTLVYYPIQSGGGKRGWGGGRWGRRAFEAMGRGFLIAQVRGFNLGQIDRL